MMPAIAPLHYLALGDSYTIGESVPAEARWPMQLVQQLRRSGVVIDDPRFVAVTGWTTDELSAGMDNTPLAPRYDLVTLLIGVNDEYRGRPAAAYRGSFAVLLQRAIALAGHHPDHVVVVSIPDWGITPFAHNDPRGAAGISMELDAYNAIAHEETVHAKAHWVDITALSRQHPEMIAFDGLHPSAAQYTLWTQAILPVARQALNSPH
jgi:lysophospholipase L1-like esterase